MSTYPHSTATTSTNETVRVQIKTHIYGLLQELADSSLQWNHVVKTILKWTPEDCVVEVEKLVQMNRNVVVQFGRTFFKQLRAKYYEDHDRSDTLPFNCGQFVTDETLGDFLSLYVRYLFQSGELQLKQRYIKLSPQDKDIISRDAYVQAFNKLLLDTYYDTLSNQANNDEESQLSYDDVYGSIKSFRSKKSRQSRTRSSQVLRPDDSVSVAESEVISQLQQQSSTQATQTTPDSAEQSPEQEQVQEQEDENQEVDDDVSASLRKMVAPDSEVPAIEEAVLEIDVLTQVTMNGNKSSELSRVSRTGTTATRSHLSRARETKDSHRSRQSIKESRKARQRKSTISRSRLSRFSTRRKKQTDTDMNNDMSVSIQSSYN